MKKSTKLYALFNENYSPKRVREMMMRAFNDGRDKQIEKIEIEII